MPQFKLPDHFSLQSGQVLTKASLYFEISGEISSDKEVVWVCHAFTGSATVQEWWPSLFKENGGFIDLNKHVLVCANLLGSCYGSTGPDSVNPVTGRPYQNEFPFITNRDVIRAFIELRKELNIPKIHYLLGGSLGGQQALEWSIMEPDVIKNQVLIASNIRHSPWGIAFNELQRRALDLGESTGEENKKKSLSLARSIAMLSYRSYDDFETSQLGRDAAGDWKVATYLNYQGEKFNGRFSIYSYKILSNMMDTHNVSEGRSDQLQAVLSKIKANTLCIGIDSDNLFPLEEQKLMSTYIPYAQLEVIESTKGHDAFLVEGNLISKLIKQHLSSTAYEKI